jgi:hypothetical protein
MKFCPTCKYYLYLKPSASDDNKGGDLSLQCMNCGYSEKDLVGGLISETTVQHKSSEAFKIMINEFTKQDNTLPHIKTIPCPREACPTNAGSADKDIIYMTYDAAGKKNLYICNVCGEQWKSRN